MSGIFIMQSKARRCIRINDPICPNRIMKSLELCWINTNAERLRARASSHFTASSLLAIFQIDAISNYISSGMCRKSHNRCYLSKRKKKYCRCDLCWPCLKRRSGGRNFSGSILNFQLVAARYHHSISAWATVAASCVHAMWSMLRFWNEYASSKWTKWRMKIQFIYLLIESDYISLSSSIICSQHIRSTKQYPLIFFFFFWIERRPSENQTLWFADRDHFKLYRSFELIVVALAATLTYATT